ncbi:MAG TPA: diacylglycerol kinase family protein [bacterium]|nr:diacylglycerol kinase family protein [bacterium]
MKKFFMSFVYAYMGIKIGFRERNMRLHGLATIIAIPLAVILKISPTEWIALIIVIVLVWSSELINTAIENICNVSRDELGAKYEATGVARDLSAGAVFVNAVGAAVVGIIIFLPKIAASI